MNFVEKKCFSLLGKQFQFLALLAFYQSTLSIFRLKFIFVYWNFMKRDRKRSKPNVSNRDGEQIFQKAKQIISISFNCLEYFHLMKYLKLHILWLVCLHVFILLQSKLKYMKSTLLPLNELYFISMSVKQSFSQTIEAFSLNSELLRLKCSMAEKYYHFAFN